MNKRRVLLACSGVRSRSQSAAVKMGWRGEEKERRRRGRSPGCCLGSLRCCRLGTGCRITQASAEAEKEEAESRYGRTVRGMEAEAEAEAKVREDGKLLYLAGGESRCLRRRDGWVTDD